MGDPDTVFIGPAAALFGMSPSALRWWEAQRVLPEATRWHGQRRYSEADLRRIGLAYLCCVVGGMPLEQAASVTTGPKDGRWREDVEKHVASIEEQITRLLAARDYLLHVTHCPDDDIVEECSHLDGELIERTPRGRFASVDLVTAARCAAATSSRTVSDVELSRDETRTERDGMDDPDAVTTHRCTVCGGAITNAPRGRRRRFCSAACRQRRYRERRRSLSAGRVVRS